MLPHPIPNPSTDCVSCMKSVNTLTLISKQSVSLVYTEINSIVSKPEIHPIRQKDVKTNRNEQTQLDSRKEKECTNQIMKKNNEVRSGVKMFLFLSLGIRFR